MKKLIVRLFNKLYPLKMQAPPLPKKAVVIGGPHTSTMDGVLMIIAFWSIGRPLKFMVKSQLGSNPFIGWIIRKLGGISVERSHHHGVVDQLVAKAQESDDFLLVIAPKGTRSVRKYWKSGFYHIAHEAGIPVIYGFIDTRAKVYGWDPTPHMLTGNMKKDMDDIRAFYEGKEGIHPELSCVPRLKGEEEE